MAKITKVEVKVSTYQNKEKKSYLFTLDDGKTGYASNKSPWEFKEGDEVSYTTEVKQSSKGSYNVFTFTRVSGSSASSTPPLPPKAPHTANIAQMKFDARMKVTELGINALIAGKFSKETDEEAATKTFIQEWSSFADTLVDEIFTGK